VSQSVGTGNSPPTTSWGTRLSIHGSSDQIPGFSFIKPYRSQAAGLLSLLRSCRFNLPKNLNGPQKSQIRRYHLSILVVHCGWVDLDV
jgi:hypothetical protein